MYINNSKGPRIDPWESNTFLKNVIAQAVQTLTERPD